MALTELSIKSLKPKDKIYLISDGGGLSLAVSPSGSKLWRLRYYYQGKEQIMGIGKYPAVSLSEARKKREATKKLLEEGKHPNREKKLEKLRKVHEGENTFEKIARHWLEMKEDSLNAKYAKQSLARMEQHVFPRIGALPLTEITIPDVVEVVEAISKRGTIETAKRMKQIIAQVFRYSAQRGLCVHNPAADLRDILPSPEEKHHACIQLEELPALLEKIEGLGNNFTKYSIKLLMLTFVRTSELIAAKWEEIDWDKEEWHIPKERMKMKRPHIMPLSSQTLAILKELQAMTGNKDFIFHSPASKSQHLSNGTVLIGLRRMGYQNKMTGHGFRTLASTILNERGYRPDAIESQLAHEDEDKIRGAYNRAKYLLERKKMMQEYADYLDSVLRDKDNKVVKLKVPNKGIDLTSGNDTADIRLITSTVVQEIHAGDGIDILSVSGSAIGAKPIIYLEDGNDILKQAPRGSIVYGGDGEDTFELSKDVLFADADSSDKFTFYGKYISGGVAWKGQESPWAKGLMGLRYGGNSMGNW